MDVLEVVVTEHPVPEAQRHHAGEDQEIRRPLIVTLSSSLLQVPHLQMKVLAINYLCNTELTHVMRSSIKLNNDMYDR